MSKYKCFNCEKKFRDNYALLRHLNRKNKCIKNINLIGSKEDLNFKCEFCDKFFSTKAHLYRHKQNNCKNYIFFLNKNLLEENKNLKKKVKNLNKNKKIINNNIMNINITINEYGKEDISHLSEKFIYDLISNMDQSSIVKMIEEVHFNNPDNKNIQLTDNKKAFIMIFKNKKWILEDKNNILDSLIVKNFDRINDVFEKEQINLNNKVINKYTNYADLFDSGERYERENIKKKTELMMLNNKL